MSSGPKGAHYRRVGDGRPGRDGAAHVGLLVGVGLLVALGVILRIHLLLSQSLNSDQAVPGLMADQVLHGHFYTFYWGQQYGGGEWFVAAVLFALFGHTPFVLLCTGGLLTAAAAVVLWRVALRIVAPDRKWLAAIVAAVFWVWPEAALWNSVHQVGFRGLTMLAGLTAILQAQRLAEDRSARTAGALGLALGLALWASPEFIYFAVVPLVMVGALARHPDTRIPLRALAAGVGAAIVGALPWLWTNIGTGFASLSQQGQGLAPNNTYSLRLSTFFVDTFPMMLGLRHPAASWMGGRVGLALYVAAGVAIASMCGLCIRRAGAGGAALTGAAIAVALLIFPFVTAFFRATDYWQDGHYGVFCVPLVLLVAAAALPERLPRSARLEVGVGVLAAAALVLTLVAYDAQFMKPTGLAGLVESAPDPNSALSAEVRGLEAVGIHYGYADYWVAYDLDFLSQGRLALADPSIDRWAGQYRQVRSSADPAWVFYDPARAPVAAATFGVLTPGPFAYRESRFLARLDALRVTYRVIDLGLLDAVITSRAVTQQEVGMPNPMIP